MRTLRRIRTRSFEAVRRSSVVACASLAANASAAGTGDIALLDPGHPGFAPESTLDILQATAPVRTTGPRLRGFGRVLAAEDPTAAALGTGGVDLSWRPDDRLAIAMVAGGGLDRLDRSRIDTSLLAEDWPTDPVRALRAGPTSFNGLDFGGWNAAAVSPFQAGRATAVRGGGTGRDSGFMATRALFKPIAGTSVGFVATHAGAQDGSVVGVDVAQSVGAHRVDAWFQQSLGGAGEPTSERDEDRTAMGASVTGRVVGIEYAFGWRRVGTNFDSELGSSGDRGTHAMTGRLGWSQPLSGIPLLARWEFGVDADVESDLRSESERLRLSIDAMRLVTEDGHTVEVGLDHAQDDDGLEGPSAGGIDRVRIGIRTRRDLPITMSARLDLAGPSDRREARWTGTARWSPGGGFDLGGSVLVEQAPESIAEEDTVVTRLDGGFGVGRSGNVRSRLDFDSRTGRLSFRHAVGVRLSSNATLSLSLEQDLPIASRSTERVDLRARFGGRIEF
ncbi:MAG: hypothetical protein VX726_07690 [Planctomycetota bacterium]|nr:hypothetical protein [Planctomycetota bacterium]